MLTSAAVNTLAHFPEGTKVEHARLASGLRMRWYERGEGPAVLFLHGFPELAVSWHFQFEGLAHRYRVIAPDMRGYGGTDAPTQVKDYTTDRLVEDVIELCDAVGESQVHLVGHDWGGALAWQVAMRKVERLRSLAVCNCPPHQLMFRDAANLEQLRRSWYIFFFQLPAIPERWLLHDPETTVQRLFRAGAVNPDNFTNTALEPYVEQLRERGLPGLNYYRAALRKPLIKLQPIRCPVRLIWGLGDPALGPQYADESLYRPFCEDFSLSLIPENVAGHWVQQEAPELVNAALDDHFSRADGRATRSGADHPTAS